MTTPTWQADSPLAPGAKLLLEASAGTGKTFQTEGLVVRLVAEGYATIGQILVITFTRAATADLRGRVRDRLVRVRKALEIGVNGDGDPVATLLLSGSEAERTTRLARVRRSLADYDQATISTIHGFCQEMLRVFAFSAGQDARGQEAADAGGLATRVIEDALAAVFARASRPQLELLAECGWSRDPLIKTAEEATQAHIGTIMPAPGGAGERPLAEVVGGILDSAVHWADLRSAAAAELLAWLDTPQGQGAIAALPGGAGAEKLNDFNAFTKDPDAMPSVRRWLEAGATPSTCPDVPWDLLGRIGKCWSDSKDNQKKPHGFADTPLAPLAERIAALEQTWTESKPPVLAIMAEHVRYALSHERQRRGLQTFSSMLTDLSDRLEAEDGAPRQPLRQAMRKRYKAALVDEFQDTDECQWSIIQRVFLESPDHHLFLVGDPKQAIYRFRGANVGVYLSAVDQLCERGGERARLSRNHRSDGPLVDAVNTLWGDGSLFGTEGLDYEAVDSKHAVRLEGGGTPFELRWFDGETAGLGEGAKPSKELGQVLCAESAARRIRTALDDTEHGLGAGEARRSLRPSDFAVLCRSHHEAEQTRLALARQGIFAITRTNHTVFDSTATHWLLAWLEAVASPEHEAAARRLALTPLLGWTASELGEALGASESARPDPAARDRWSALRRATRSAAEAWRTRGFAGLFPDFLHAHGAHARIVASIHGERGATDLLDLATRCDLEQRRARLGPGGLAEWLKARVAAQEPDEDAALQIESDADAVTISTIHASKGLQFGVVLVPFCWYAVEPKESLNPIRYSRRDGATVDRIFDLHPSKHPARAEAILYAHEETRQEDMRLLYVALTRARHQVIAWGGAYSEVGESSLARLLGLDEGVATDATAEAALADLDKDALFSFVKEPPLAQVTPRAATSNRLPVPLQPWDRKDEPGAGWQVASYSSMARGRGVELDWPAAVDDEAEPSPTDHPVELPLALERPDDTLLARAPGHDLRGGTATGLWLHTVFEDLDFQSSPVAARDGRSLDQLVRDAGVHHGVTDPGQWALALSLVDGWLATPLDGPGLQGLPAGFTLRGLALADRADELEFHLRLGGGHGPLGDERIDPQAARRALERALDSTFRGRTWLEAVLSQETERKGVRLPRPVLPKIAGFLNGLVDLTFRVETAEGPRYFICDYKSNQLSGTHTIQEATAAWGAAPDDPNGATPRLRRWHYTSQVMAWGMAHSAYHLQALLYTVALHRLLRQRLPNYDYDRHVGGHLYLFLRGMEGEGGARDGEGAPLGVWTDRWPRETVEGLSAALGGER